MHTSRFVILSLAGIFSLGTARSGPADKTSAPEPPEIIKITREVVKPGKTAAVIRNGVAAARSLASAKWPRVSIGLTSVTGPEEVWFLSFPDSLGSLEDDWNEMDKTPALKADLEALSDQEETFLSSKRDIVALHQKDLTYRPNFDWSQMRYLDAITIHVRPGHHLEYLEMRKMAFEGHQKGGLDTHLIVYKVTSGLPGVTFFILRPLQSLHGHDVLRQQGFGELMSEEDHFKMVRLLGASVDLEEEAFFRVEPRISHVTTSWAKSGASFWAGSSK